MVKRNITIAIILILFFLIVGIICFVIYAIKNSLAFFGQAETTAEKSLLQKGQPFIIDSKTTVPNNALNVALLDVHAAAETPLAVTDEDPRLMQVVEGMSRTSYQKH
ncbi:hypothetical protein I7I51_07096 [Histoplasma capsulatum]|uniref:Uncharacterized protein n=1 Tax=Ajellomyces capsulatus TaxID=5037 RepID=A0A8A1MK21_AJECA|nr:hypothetical protein I7I51_07096 [Histoplasma capsulatum]